jgi:hypothetical protein
VFQIIFDCGISLVVLNQRLYCQRCVEGQEVSSGASVVPKILGGAEG